ncbi:putative mbre TPR repeat protein [Monocercomonoides exilis]|uniref:putative mbre TPR repeat protein n=1 Tax=Monocercomonoides exilis TaxID=2049356 RepID=UPI00355A8C0E|nr:putative mbre TPR repeat protein [Monocercomonoides exilis]|eukprot:MONOS_6107.1-p1 / transcript=MONOS_6107.1 / gene=MONOS_6107 / organism=Monocercomonoides_exilis_PA203 / gene_product=mbre TPR repeat protein / transcript_product=mbre TPR repeat protein / location=Mono_scaffold00188:34140-36756(+) / protein_length=693 / sequence_SO=supercontig / SO=protein_coding / is_pseudo=false
MHIDEEWKHSPMKQPPLSVVLKDHVGKGGTTESYKTLQVDAHEFLVEGEYEKCIETCNKCIKKINQTLGPSSPELIYAKLILCEVYTELTRYSDAMKMALEVGALLDSCPGLTDGHIFKVYYYRDLGTLHRIQVRLDDALACFQKVVETRRKFQGERHPDTALALVDLAIVHKMRGEYDRAIQLLQYALVVQEDCYGSDSIHVASNLFHQGAVYICASRWVEAKEALKQGMLIMMVNGMNEHPDMASAECNLGIVSGQLEKYDEAIEHFEKARLLREKIFGLAHPDTAGVYIHISRQLHAQGLLDEAESYVNKALTILESTAAGMKVQAEEAEKGASSVSASSATLSGAPSDASIPLSPHPSGDEKSLHGSVRDAAATRSVKSVSGVSKQKAPSLMSARVPTTTAARQAKKTPPTEESNPKVFEGLAACRMMMGQILVTRGKFEEARKQFNVAKELFQSLPGHEDDVKELDTQIANAFLTEGASGDALEIFQSLLDQIEAKHAGGKEGLLSATQKAKRRDKKKRRSFDEDDEEENDDPADPNLASVVNGMGNAYRQQGELEEAMYSYRRALRIYEKSVGVFDPSTAIVHMNMGNTYYAAEKLHQAMSHYTQARAIRERIFGSVHPQTCAAYRSIGAVYFALDSFDEALDVYGKAADAMEVLRGETAPEVQAIRRTMAEIVRERAQYKAEHEKQ